MKSLHWLLYAEGRKYALTLSVLLEAAIAVADDLTGKSLSLGAFYLLPVVLVTWHGGRAWGFSLSLVSTALVAVVALHVGNPFPSTMYLYGYFGAILLMLIIVTEAVAQLRVAFHQKTGKL